jgi:hypothetical protein
MAHSRVGIASAGKKMAVLCGTAKFREETSKKADSAVKDRIAATHNLGGRPFLSKHFLRCTMASPRQPAASA